MGCYGIYYFQVNVKTIEFVVLDNMNNRFIVFCENMNVLSPLNANRKRFKRGYANDRLSFRFRPSFLTTC